MNQPRLFQLDQRALRRSFERASRGYDGAAMLQRAVQKELLERLQYFRLKPQLVLDLGAGTGQATVPLRQRFPRSRILAIDVAFNMLRRARRWQWPWQKFSRVCADACALPLAAGSVDLVFSNLMLQWCDRPQLVFSELQRVLKPDGLLLFSTFGPDTLQELRLAWSQADAHAHVSDFPDMPQLSAAMQQAGLTEAVLDIDRRVVHYTDAGHLMQELRTLGARNAHAARSRGLTGRRRLTLMQQTYEQARTPRGLPATYEIIHGAAFAGRGPTSAAGESVIPLGQLKTRQRE